MTTPLPSTLETPPRTTGDPKSDLPLLIDWFWKAYQVIRQAVDYITDTISPSVTAVEADVAAVEGRLDTVEGRLDGLITGTFVLGAADTGAVVTFGTAQADTNYRVIVTPQDFSGAPAVSAFVVVRKVYTAADFTVTMLAAPGGGNTTTWEWQLIRNS